MQATAARPQETAPETHAHARAWLVIALLLTAATYAGTFSFQFVYDDIGFIVGNPVVHSIHYFPQYFTHSLWWNLIPGDYYRPFFLTWVLLNYLAFGLNPIGWHVTAVALHVGVTALAFFVARRLSGDVRLAGIAALFFGIHPVHIEVVSWVAGATESLVALFMFASFLAYLIWHDTRKPRWAAISLLFFAAALLSKETAVVLPLLILAHAYLFRQKPRTSSALRASVPFFLLLAAYLAVRLAVLKTLAAPALTVSPKTAMFTVPSVLLFYLRHLLAPVGLSEFYELPYVEHFGVASVLVPVLVIIAACLGVWWWARRERSPLVAFAGLWLLIPVLPALNIQGFNRSDFAHERYVYIASFGFVVLVAAALAKLPPGARVIFGQPLSLTIVLIGLTALACFGTAYQSAYWTDNLALYSRGVHVAPHNRTALNDLSVELIQRGQYQRAIEFLDRDVALYPGDYSALFNLGYAYYQLGSWEQAIRYLDAANRLAPVAINIFMEAGARLHAGQTAEGTADLRRVVAMDPNNVKFRLALANVLADQGACAEAREHIDAALSLDRVNATALQLRAKCAQP